jgi:hypothetical protein
MHTRPLTPLERETIAILETHNPTSELLICLDGLGQTEIDRTTGAIDRASLTQTMLDARKAGDVCLWHNHPSRGSLSTADWTQCRKEIKTTWVAAVNDAGSWFRGRLLQPLSSRLDVDDQTSAIHALVTEPGPVVDDFISDFFDDLGWLCSHLVNLRLKQLGVIEYDFELHGRDEVRYSDADAAGRIDQALTTLARTIPTA